jgi:hypothetical protein
MPSETPTVAFGAAAPVVANSADTTAIPPGPATAVHATVVGSYSITLAWNAPKTGTQPFSYLVLIKAPHALTWTVAAVSTATSAHIDGLEPATTYSIEILTIN